MKKVSSSNALKSMRRVSSGNALKEMAVVATSSMRRVSSGNALKEMAEVAVIKLKEKKQAMNVKGIMKRVGSKKVARRRKTKDTDGDSVETQYSPESDSEMDGAESTVWENVSLYDVEVDDATLADMGLDPPVTYSMQEEAVAHLPEFTPVPEKKVKIVPPIPAENLVQVVLLLVDDITRRFELVTLDFDSTNARVVDILTEIPNVTTDESLREKKYVAICSRRGAEMDDSKLLTEYFRREFNNTLSNFALAVPKGMNAKESLRIASPILSDNKILSMLKIEKESLSVENKADTYSTKKIKGPYSTKSSERKRMGKVDERRPRSASITSILKKKPKLATPTPSISSDATKQLQYIVTSSLILTFAIFFIALISMTLKDYNKYISSPLGPGDILREGEKRHKCGLLRFLPEERTGCHSLTLENDGTGNLGLYDGEELLWQIYVPTCNEGCSVTLNDDGKVIIGDHEGVFSSLGPSNVSPWPFSQNIRNSYKKRNPLIQ